MQRSEDGWGSSVKATSERGIRYFVVEIKMRLSKVIRTPFLPLPKSAFVGRNGALKGLLPARAREFVNSFGRRISERFPNADRRALSVIPECWYSIYATRGRPRYVADYFT